MKFLRIASSVIVLICLVMVEGIPLDTSTLRYKTEAKLNNPFLYQFFNNHFIKPQISISNVSSVSILNDSRHLRKLSRHNKSPQSEDYYKLELLRNLKNNKFANSEHTTKRNLNSISSNFYNNFISYNATSLDVLHNKLSGHKRKKQPLRLRQQSDTAALQKNKKKNIQQIQTSNKISISPNKLNININNIATALGKKDVTYQKMNTSRIKKRPLKGDKNTTNHLQTFQSTNFPTKNISSKSTYGTSTISTPGWISMIKSTTQIPNARPNTVISNSSVNGTFTIKITPLSTSYASTTTPSSTDEVDTGNTSGWVSLVKSTTTKPPSTLFGITLDNLSTSYLASKLFSYTTPPTTSVSNILKNNDKLTTWTYEIETITKKPNINTIKPLKIPIVIELTPTILNPTTPKPKTKPVVKKNVNNKKNATTKKPKINIKTNTVKPFNKNKATFQKNRKPAIKPTPKPPKKKASTRKPSKVSTKRPMYSWPNDNIKNEHDYKRYKNYTNINFSSSKGNKKPNLSKPPKKNPQQPIRRKRPLPNNKHKNKIKRKKKPDQTKQTWFEPGVPYPNPMPEISSNSPQFSIGDISSSEIPVQILQDEVYEELPNSENFSEENIIADSGLQQLYPPTDSLDNLQNPLSTFNLNMAPAEGIKNVNGVNPCPSVQISSSVFNPQLREECSDLHLVINSHFHQNSGSDRRPGINTYQAEPVAEDTVPAEDEVIGEQADLGVAQADGVAEEGAVGAADAAEAAAAPAAEAAVGGTGGTGGVGGAGGAGGDGGDGSGSGLSLPSLKQIFDVLGLFGGLLGRLLGFFKFLLNPYLYTVPMTIFFIVGFLITLALFPWWVPLLFLYVGVSAKKKSSLTTHYKHVHPPVHHEDGWFWNHASKTWENINQYVHARGFDSINNFEFIPRAIENFAKKYNLKLS